MEQMMGKEYRISIDLGELKEAIEQARPKDPAWSELSMAGKVRTLLAERLHQIGQDSTDGKK